MVIDGRESEAISFAEFDLDASRRRLSRNGEALAINAKTFDLLTFLIENNGRVVSKDEILDAVWPDQFVEEANLSVQISALRKALGEKKETPRFLITIPGKGYKFVAGLHWPQDDLIIETHKYERIVVHEEVDEAPDPHIAMLSGKNSRYGISVGLLAGLLLLSVAGLVWYRYYFAAPAAEVKSLAVLPFANQNPAPETEYLSEGLAESVIGSLSRLPGLRVISRNSAFRYGGNEIDAKRIGGELGVQAILTGRITQIGDAVSISTELISTVDDSVIWADRFTRPAADMERLQADVARAISQKLQLKLSGSARVDRAAASPEVYQLYLLGRYHIGKLTDDGFYKGRDHFQKAIEKDPDYAPAYAGLAETYNRLSAFNVVPPNEGYMKARPLAIRALSLDDQLAEAHAALGTVNHFYDWDWASAEAEFKRAIEISPNNSDTRLLYGYHLASMRRFDEAQAEMKLAQELDPLSLEKIVGVGDVFYFRHRFDDALAQYEKIIDMDANSGFGHWAVGNVYVQKAMYAEAVEKYKKAIPLSGKSPDESATLAYAYALMGNRREAMKIVEELKKRSELAHIPPSIIAFVYAGLDEKDEAFLWLEKAYERRDFLIGTLNVEPLFDKLRDDPRLDDMVRRVGLPLGNLQVPNQ